MFVLVGLLISPPALVHASSSSPDSVHFCVPFDYEQWRRDHPQPAAKRLADLDAGEPRTVRMIYFLPNDRRYRQEVVDSTKVVIRQAQAFYAEQMEAHGYGNATFRFETDVQGEPLVHRVDADHSDEHYLGNTEELTEVERGFDFSSNVYLIVSDNSSNAAGRAAGLGGQWGKGGGWALVPGGFSFATVAHELGHAFELGHDFRDNNYIMSYGHRRVSLSACAAEFLAVHPYFNPDIPIEEGLPPDIKLLSPTEYPAGSRRVSVQLELSDSDGLYQVILYGSGGLVACRLIGGKKDAVVSFEYEGAYSPSDGFRSLLDGPSHGIGVSVVDTRGDVNGTFFVYEEASPHLITTWEGHTGRMMSVSFSPDGTLVASAGDSEDSTVKLWNVATREHIGTLGGHEDGGFLSTAFSPNGGTLATSSWNGGIKLWDVATRTEVFNFILGGGRYVVFSPDGGTVAIASWDRTIRLWDLATKTRVANLEGHTDEVASLAFSPDGGTVATASWDRTVRLWDVATRTEVGALEGHLYEIYSVAFSPDGATLASGSSYSPGLDMLKLWDVSTRMEIANLKGHRTTVRSVAFSPDGSTLASASWDLTVRLWDVVTRKQVAALGHASAVNSVSFSPDGSILASGSDDGQVRLWDVSEWTGPRPFALEVISGDGQQGAPGAALAKPLVVEVRDQYGNLLPEAAITFTVTAGDGQLSGRFTVEHTTTDANGRAELPLTLGLHPGPNTVGVSIGGRELATFTAEGVGTAVAELEGDYRTWHLPRAATVRLGKGAMGEGDRALALSPDGRCLAVSSGIGVWLYEAATSRALALLPSESLVHSVAFSVDGTLAAGLDNGEVALLEVETGERIATLRHADWGWITSVVFSADGTRLASGSWDQVIKLWDVETRREVGTWEVPWEFYAPWPLSVAFSPEAGIRISGRHGPVVGRGDTDGGGHHGRAHRSVTSVSFSPDGATLASSGGWDDPTVRLWDAATQVQVAILRGHTGEVRSVSFSSPDGATLASGSSDRTVKLWDVGTQEEVATFEEHRDGIRSVTFSPDGVTLISGAADGAVLIRDLETGNVAGFSGHGTLSSMALSPDGTLLASGYGDGTIRLWDAATRVPIATFEGHTSGAGSVSFSFDGTLLASGSLDRTVRLWDVKTRELLKALEGHTGGVTSVTFSPDGALLASAGGWNDATVWLWDVGTREPIGTLEGHTNDVRSVAFSPDGALLASAGGYEDKTVKLWNVATRELIASLEDHTGSVNSVVFSPDGKTLASGSSDGTVRLSDAATRTPISSLDNRSSVYSLAFSSDGAVLASGSWDRTVKLWDVETREQIGTLQGGHTGSVHSVAFFRDGATLVSGASDGTMLLWDLQRLESRPHSLRPVSGLEHQGPAGGDLADPFVVLVLDQNGEPVAGAQVTFAVTAGGGTLSVETATTDENGRAATTLTLGSQPGTNTVVASVKDLEPVTFTATTRAASDFDGDGTVGFADFVRFAAQFGLSQGDEGYDARYDLDENGAIGFSDFVIFAQAFGREG